VSVLAPITRVFVTSTATATDASKRQWPATLLDCSKRSEWLELRVSPIRWPA
jgi:hypothetical protein